MFSLVFPAHVTRILDGDTLEAEVSDFVTEVSIFGVTFVVSVIKVVAGGMELEAKKTIRIRLLDCWSPELKEPGGKDAKQALSLLTQDRPCKVHVRVNEQGKFGDSLTFGRILARVEVEGKDVSSIMVESGHATRTKKK